MSTRHLSLSLLGDPVAHSRSPVIHREAMRLTGLRGEYAVVRADEGRLAEEIARLRRGELAGINVTMPLKEAAFDMCDRHTADASQAGSVNALRMRAGRVEGHSTDVVAFRSLLEIERPRSVLTLGAGGAARAALVGLAGEWPVYLAARNGERASALAERHSGVVVVRWGCGVAGAWLVNATPLGMSGEALDEELVDPASTLVDLPYADRPTPAVTRALRTGIPVFDGVEFLARQAAAAFTWWTDEPIDSAALVAAARNG